MCNNVWKRPINRKKILELDPVYAVPIPHGDASIWGSLRSYFFTTFSMISCY